MMDPEQRFNTTLSAGVDLESRRVYIVGEIDQEAVARTIIGLNLLNESNGQIFLTLSSNGGSEKLGFAIYDAIQQSRCSVVIEGIGGVESIAVLVLQAGSIRRISENCRLMIHNGSMEVKGEMGAKEFIAFAKDTERLSDVFNAIVGRRAGVSKEKIQQMCDAETYFSAIEAVRFGLADEIIPARPRGRQRRRAA